jgi:hypothetical protein
MADDDLRYYRKPWMTDDQWACAKMFASVVGGFHHVCGEFKPCGHGIKLHCSSGGWASFDYSRLTGLVVRAHDEMVRVELIPSGPGRIGFAMWKRHTREGGISARHPTIEDAIAMHRPRALTTENQTNG